MGGKTKHVNRTKNNVKPSSSGRSAELMASSTIPATIGFASVSDFGFLPSMVSGLNVADNASTTDDMDASVDTNYQLVFRKMTKKDPTTKVKALQEFAELLSRTEVADIKAILPFWPRLYNNLSTDVEHRVREAAQQAQSSLINQAGKSIAPYLKQIAASWITSQYDTYAPAASIAAASFQKAFPKHKQQDVFNFCQGEILDYIIKYLTYYTATTLSNPQANTPEECEAKYHRVLICSLKGYALYLSKMSADQLREASNKNTALIENGKFWSYHKHKDPNVRAAWFETLSALLQFSPSFLENFEKQTASSALQNLDETETVVLPHVWASILLVTQKISDWHTHVNIEKALLPKLWKILKTGGGGSAETIYPHLLPLVSKLNKDILGDKTTQFYSNFFENINTGLSSRVIHPTSSRSEVTAIATAYYECLQFIVIQLRSNDLFDTPEELTDYCIKLTQAHIIEVIGLLLDNSSSHSGKFVLARMILLVQFWAQNAADNKIYAALVQHFWSNVYSVVEKSLSTADDDTAHRLELTLELVHCLRSRHSHKPKGAKVKFNLDGSTDEIDCVAVVEAESNVAADTELPEFVLKLSKMYVKKVSDTTNSVFIDHLESLLKIFGNVDFYRQLSVDGGNICKLYDKFACWLLIGHLRQENVVDLILMLYPHLNAEERMSLLGKLVKFPNPMVQNWILSRILSHPLCIDPDVVNFIGQPSVIELLVKAARAVANGSATDNINLLHKCFFQNEAGDILIDCNTCEQIADIVLAPLNEEEPADEVLDTCASFIAQIMPVVCGDDKKKSTQTNIFLSLFALSCHKTKSANLSEDTLWEVVTSWQDALSSRDIQLNEELLKSCAEIIHKNVWLAADDESLLESLESYAEIVSKLILCSIEHLDDGDDAKYRSADSIISTVFNLFRSDFENNLLQTQQICAFVDAINGNLITTPASLRLQEADLGKIQFQRATINLFKLSILKFRVISKTTCNIKENRKSLDTTIDSTDEDEYTEDYCDLDANLLKKWSKLIIHEILSGLKVSGLGNSLLGVIESDSLIESLIIHLQERVVLFLTNIPKANAENIRDLLFDDKRLKDYLVSASLWTLLNIEPYRDSAHGLALLHNDITTKLNPNDNIESYLNVLQHFAPKIGQRQLAIAPNSLTKTPELYYRTVGLRHLIRNYFDSDMNEITDHQIYSDAFKLVDDFYTLSKLDKEFFLYNENLVSIELSNILHTTEIINFLTEIVSHFAANLSADQWDFIRIAISSWVLTVSKSSDHFRKPKVAIFTSAVYKLFTAFYEFINSEAEKSSTHLLKDVIDEWEQVFAKDVNLILLKCFMRFLHKSNNDDGREKYFLETISQFVDKVELKFVLIANKIDSKTSIDDLVQYLLKGLSHKCHRVRTACAVIMKKLTPGLIERDIEAMNKRNDSDNSPTKKERWHLLERFNQALLKYVEWSRPLIEEFNYKTVELDDFSEVHEDEAIPFLLLWDCVLHVCNKAQPEMRSIYAAYLAENKHDQTLLNLLFRLMPLEILRNQDSKIAGSLYFAHLPWSHITSPDLCVERYACYIYTLALKHLPVIVRKWWTNSKPRQKSLVDKITTAFVSNQLCQDEWRALLEKKEKQDSIALTVHSSTREVHATYSIDEARMELIVQLPPNYPLGTVKISCGRQTGDKLQSKQVVMQLSIFLTHQNGSIGDGLSLWKGNLDRKFEGVEECYVCYSVIHQETYQLPKLTCKTCKKKFHGQCLYKWFSTSNKSTCPICRNIF